MDWQLPIPERGAAWYPTVAEFALSYNAYDREGGSNAVAERAKTLKNAWFAGEAVFDEVPRLRSALFFEQRRWRHLDQEPTGREREYIDALIEGIRRLAGDTVPGPADPLP
jgi:hypothetical protein